MVSTVRCNCWILLLGRIFLRQPIHLRLELVALLFISSMWIAGTNH
jgi:hypothetical protein